MPVPTDTAAGTGIYVELQLLLDGARPESRLLRIPSDTESIDLDDTQLASTAQDTSLTVPLVQWSSVGTVGGVAPLDASGVVPSIHLPPPQVVEGPAGEDGVGVSDAAVDDEGLLRLSLTDATTLGPWNVRGPQGIQGLQGMPGTPGADGIANRVTVASWEASRTADEYYIVHRGGGDIVPENSIEAYERAFSLGAQAFEISVHLAPDGELWVNHDTTTGRTGDPDLPIASTPSTALRMVKLSKMTQTGSAWSGSNGPRMVRFEEILRRWGGRAVLFCEAKADAAYPSMVALIERYGLKDCTVIKAFHSSARLAEAKSAGYKTFGYFGTKAEVTQANVDSLVARNTDYIVLPYFDVDVLTPMPDAEVARCVATGRHVLMYPLHRRVDVARNKARGVRGFITAGPGYVDRSTALATVDQFWSGAATPGLLTLDQSGASYAPTWVASNILRLARAGQHFVTLGDLSPIANAAGTYRITFEAAWSTLPGDLNANLTLAFGRADDSYYQHQRGVGGGYHAICRGNGQVQLYRHTDGSTSGTQLDGTASTTAPTAGLWMRFQLDVTPTQLTWARTDVPGSTTFADSTHRGGYVHIGKTDGVLDIRNVAVT